MIVHGESRYLRRGTAWARPVGCTDRADVVPAGRDATYDVMPYRAVPGRAVPCRAGPGRAVPGGQDGPCWAAPTRGAVQMPWRVLSGRARPCRSPAHAIRADAAPRQDEQGRAAPTPTPIQYGAASDMARAGLRRLDRAETMHYRADDVPRAPVPVPRTCPYRAALCRTAHCRAWVRPRMCHAMPTHAMPGRTASCAGPFQAEKRDRDKVRIRGRKRKR